MDRPRRTLTANGRRQSRPRWFVVQWNGASEDLCSDESSPLDVNPKSATDLNHDHCKREDIRLLAECPPTGKDLRCNPPCTLPILVWSAPCRIQVLSDRGETAIRDQRTTGGVHKDVRLVGYQYPAVKR